VDVGDVVDVSEANAAFIIRVQISVTDEFLCMHKIMFRKLRREGFVVFLFSHQTEGELVTLFIVLGRNSKLTSPFGIITT
jgi:hypothetical protein